MANWQHHVKLRHIIDTGAGEDHASVQESMTKLADAIDKEVAFTGFNTKPFRRVPKGDDFYAPIDYANKLIGRMYDFADVHRIWVD